MHRAASSPLQAALFTVPLHWGASEHVYPVTGCPTDYKSTHTRD
jgi:hypothetical protein